MRAWPVVMSVVRALSEAATVEAALEAMAQLPACFTASLLPDVSQICISPPVLCFGSLAGFPALNCMQLLRKSSCLHLHQWIPLFAHKHIAAVRCMINANSWEASLTSQKHITRSRKSIIKP